MRDGPKLRAANGWRRSREWRYNLQGESMCGDSRSLFLRASVNDGRTNRAVRLTLSLDSCRVEMQLRGIPGNKPSFRSRFVSLANNL
jgi:hypothetical protein